ncbi:MAG: hypothetical protein JNM10_00265 [Planctomycetia bacterium]|nr:hypothetical protein [Planctomycetia bacterium]
MTNPQDPTPEQPATPVAPMAPSRTWWVPSAPQPEAAFSGPMSGARLRAIVGFALWTLALLAVVAVVVAAVARGSGIAVRDSWAWEVYKTLAQLIVAALGVGFAYAFPLRLQAQKVYGEARAETLQLAEDLDSLAKNSNDAASMRRLNVRAIELRARFAALAADAAVIAALEMAMSDASRAVLTRMDAESSNPNLYRILNPTAPQLELIKTIGRASEQATKSALRLAKVAASAPPP